MWFAFGKPQVHVELIIKLKLQTDVFDLCGDGK